MPTAHVVPRPFFAGEHSLLHDPVDFVEADVGLPLGTGREGVLADEVAIRVVQKGALFIQHPGIAGLAGTDAFRGRAQQVRHVHHAVEGLALEAFSPHGRADEADDDRFP